MCTYGAKQRALHRRCISVDKAASPKGWFILHYVNVCGMLSAKLIAKSLQNKARYALCIAIDAISDADCKVADCTFVNKCVDNIKSRKNILSLQKETLGVIALNFRGNITFYLRQFCWQWMKQFTILSQVDQIDRKMQRLNGSYPNCWLVFSAKLQSWFYLLIFFHFSGKPILIWEVTLAAAIDINYCAISCACALLSASLIGEVYWSCFVNFVDINNNAKSFAVQLISTPPLSATLVQLMLSAQLIAKKLVSTYVELLC